MSPSQLQRANLEDERTFLEASLADAEREHEAGDLSDEDYRLLRQRDQRRLDEVERQLSAEAAETTETIQALETDGAGTPKRNGSSPDDDATPPRYSRQRLVLGLAGAALVIIGAVVLVVHLTTNRLPGQPATGTVQLSQAQRINEELAQADVLLQSNDVQGAITIYSEVVSQDPHDPAALAQLGWLTYEQGVVASDTKTVNAGRDLVQEAITADPTFGPAHLYDGVILLRTADDPAGAVTQFRQFLSDHPSKQNLQNGGAFIRQAFADEHLPPPTAVASATRAR